MTGDHEFIEVKDRRLCCGCDLFQSKEPGAQRFPVPRNECPRDTPYARRIDREAAVPPDPVDISPAPTVPVSSTGTLLGDGDTVTVAHESLVAAQSLNK